MEVERQWFIRSCVVCVLTCIIGLSCCAYCTYIVNNTLKLFSVSKKQSDYSGHQFTEDVVFDPVTGNIAYEQVHHQTRLKRDINIVNIQGTPQPEYTRGSKKERKQKKKKKRRDGKKKGRKNKLMATHYVLKAGIHDPGASCPIPVRRTSHKRSHLEDFTPAAFVEDKTNPFKHYEGKFFVQEKGLYLVYAQVLFEDCREDQIMVVVQKRDNVIIQEYFCFVGVGKSIEKNNNTCSITGLFYMEKGDVISMENYYPEVHINYRSYNSTFIGAVLLNF